jgi:hypothetical protein
MERQLWMHNKRDDIGLAAHDSWFGLQCTVLSLSHPDQDKPSS